MTYSTRARLAAAASVLMATAALGAQGAPSVQLAFGYECGDRFLVKNDGNQPVSLEWKTSGGVDRSQLRLNAKESREIASASNESVELWVSGKLVATEQKGNKACGGNAAPESQSVVVRPLDATNMAGQNGEDPPSRVARLSSMQGGVSFQAAGSAEWGVATVNSSITTGDRLVADDGGRAELEIGTLAVRIGSSTDLTVTNLTDGLLQLGVPAGTLRLGVYRMNSGDTIEVDTPNGAINIVAPGSYRIATNVAGTQSVLSVERGRAEVSGPNVSQTIEENRTVRLTADGGSVQIANVPHPGPDGFDSWSSFRDGALSSGTSASEAYVNPDVPGVRDLDASGRWENDAVSGPVWYPTAVETGWVPYRYGHWGWVEPWGWTWIADESWGFAPFHYGRWSYVRNRWGWVPGPRLGRPYYAPALVAFADGGGFGVSVGVSAWFPLGPRDPFLPWYHHDDRYLRMVNGANVRGVTDINVFVHVQDVEHYRYAHRTNAMTVVPTVAFAAGRPVEREIVRVPPARIATAHIVSHPGGVPTREAVIGGAVAPRPHAAVERMVAVPVERGMDGRDLGRDLGRGRQQAPTRTSITQEPRPLVNRAPLPQAQLPFEARQKAIAQHPGRPLEPQQIQNMRAGRPAGPQKDPVAAPPKVRPPDKREHREAKKVEPPKDRDKKPE